jgi:DNA-binding NtrC family response regulator
MAPEILYLSDRSNTGDPVLAALEAAGYEVVSTDSCKQAIALLFVMHSVAAIVLHQGENSVEAARNLHAIHLDVPIVLLANEQIVPLPSFVDGVVSTKEPPSALVAEVNRVLNAKPVP